MHTPRDILPDRTSPTTPGSTNVCWVDPSAPGPDDERPPLPPGAPDLPAAEVHGIGRRTYLVADVEPLDVTGVRTVGVGTALWLLGFVLLLPFQGWLADTGRTWWLWTCIAGFGLGMFGVDFCRRRAKRGPRLD